MATKFVFLLLPHIHLMDLAGPDQVFFEAIGYEADFEIQYCAFSDNLRSTAGLPLGKMPHFSEITLKSGDFLIVAGADIRYLHSEELKAETTLLAWIAKVYQEKVNICSICSGAFLLALSGVLDGRNCTTHWKRTQELQAHFPKIKVIENVLFTEDSGIFTSAGIASGMDMALHIVEKLKGEYFAHKVARELVLYNRRKGNHAQQSALMNHRNHLHSGIHKAQDWLHEHLDKKISLAELAEQACMSERNLSRVFKKEAGVTVNEYLTLLRRERILELKKNPNLTKREIARQCGLKSERHINRILEQ